MASPTFYRSKLCPPQVKEPVSARPWIPSIFTATPEEHIREAEYAKWRRRFLPPHIRHGQQNASPLPPGHIRVLFWSSVDNLRVWRPVPDLTAEIPLEPTGYLDLTKVQKLWGLESAVIIDPMRWEPFENVTFGRLSPLAVHTLSYNGHIFVTEHPVSTKTRAKREFRLRCLDIYYNCFFNLYRLVFHGGYFGPRYHPPVPRWYNQLSCYRNRAVKQFKELKTGADDAYDTVILHSTRGFVTLGGKISRVLQGTVIMDRLDSTQVRMKEFLNDWGFVLITCLIFFSVFLIDSCFQL